MNASAQEHLDLAAGYVARGEEFYRKAAEEIAAAREADSTLSFREIGERVGYSETWVKDLLSWRRRGHDGSRFTAPVDQSVGGRNARGARTFLRDAPLEEVEEIVAALPVGRKAIVARAAANVQYRQAREEYEQEEASLTPAQRQEREAAAAELVRPVRQAAAGFAALGVAGHLEQATEDLRQIVEDGDLTSEVMEPVRGALLGFLVEYNVAAAMAGLDTDLEMRP